MKRLGLFVTFLAVAIFLSVLAFGQTPKDKSRVAAPVGAVSSKIPEFVKSRAIMNVRGVEAVKLIGKQVAVDGFYYDGSIPMIVDDIRRVLVDMVMPPDSYVPIVGPRPKGVKSGDRISLKGETGQAHEFGPRLCPEGVDGCPACCRHDLYDAPALDLQVLDSREVPVRGQARRHLAGRILCRPDRGGMGLREQSPALLERP